MNTLKPLEKRIIKDFELSKVVVCTDAGLSSTKNRKFNNTKNRAFVTVQSIKKLKSFLKKWTLDPKNWKPPNDPNLHDISKITEEENNDYTYYKERWIKENDLEQRIIVTYSLKYKNYQRKIHDRQIDRAHKKIATKEGNKNKNPNSPTRFIKEINVTKGGEVAKEKVLLLDQSVIDDEEKYDSFYCVCTNLEDDASEIVKINHRRWEIEETFRILKSEFKAPPYTYKEMIE